MLIASVALAVALCLAGLAEAQSRDAVRRPGAPALSGPLMGIEPITDTDATLTYWDGSSMVTIDLGAKMINCNTPGAPSGGSTGTVPSPYHPCR